MLEILKNILYILFFVILVFPFLIIGVLLVEHIKVYQLRKRHFENFDKSKVCKSILPTYKDIGLKWRSNAKNYYN